MIKDAERDSASSSFICDACGQASQQYGFGGSVRGVGEPEP